MFSSSSVELALLEIVDVEVDRGVEGGQQVAQAGRVGQPAWPLHQNLRNNRERLNLFWVV